MNIKPFTELDYIELEKMDALDRINKTMNNITKLVGDLIRTDEQSRVFYISTNIINQVTRLTSDKLYLIDLEKGRR